MKIKSLISLLCPLLFFLSSVCLSSENENFKFDYVTYAATTDHKFLISWDPVENAIHYGLRLYNLERKTTIILPPTKETSMELNFPYSGHFTVRVRACNLEDENLETPCSDWADSTNPKYSTVDGEQRAWWLYGYIAPPEEFNFLENP